MPTNNTNNKEQIIKEISKNSLEKIIISLRVWRDKKLLDIRLSYQDNQGNWRFTKKGISLNVDKISELKSGILLLEEAIKKF